MPAVFVSCPCCGMSVPPAALNFDEHGNRVAEPKLYDTLVKLRTAGGYKKIRWTTDRMPGYMLRGLRVQLQRALEYVESQLESLSNQG